MSDELWNAVKARQTAIRDSAVVTKARATRLWERRRAQHLLTGLVHCGACGSRMPAVSRDYRACSAARGQGTSSNRKGVRRAPLEELILDGLRQRLMASSMVEEFVTAFHEEVNCRRRHETAARAGELAEVTRKLDNLIEALIEDTAPLACSSAWRSWKRKGALERDLDEALGILRRLIERVVIRPGRGRPADRAAARDQEDGGARPGREETGRARRGGGLRLRWLRGLHSDVVSRSSPRENWSGRCPSSRTAMSDPLCSPANSWAFQDENGRGGQVKAELVSVGQSGEQSLKRIETAGEHASGGLKGLGRQAELLRTGIRALGGALVGVTTVGGLVALVDRSISAADTIGKTADKDWRRRRGLAGAALRCQGVPRRADARHGAAALHPEGRGGGAGHRRGPGCSGPVGHRAPGTRAATCAGARTW